MASSSPNAHIGVSPADVAPLSVVIKQVEDALNQYQRSLGGGPDALPPLESAEFSFKAITATTVGGTVNFLILKFGGSHENEVAHEVTFTYAVPAPPVGKELQPPT